MKFFGILSTVLPALFLTVGALATEAPTAQEQALLDGQVKGHIHRQAVQVERESVEAIRLAKELADRGIYDRVTDDEVRAIAELAYVQETARNFRNAVASENYYDNPAQSRQAYIWLHRAFVVVEHDPIISTWTEVKRGPVAQLEQTMRRLRGFYTLAERLGWSMAEVVILADDLEQHTARVYNLALRETDNPREARVLQLLDGLRQEAAGFHREARSIRNPGNARRLLSDNFRRLQARFRTLDRVIEDPHFVRYSRPVRLAYDQVQDVYRDIVLAFLGN